MAHTARQSHPESCPIQALPRASGECWLAARVQPTVSFYITQSLNTPKFTTTSPGLGAKHAMSEILQAVAMGFGKEDSLTAGVCDDDAFLELMSITPQQVLPFYMHMADDSSRHLILPKLQGPLKTLITLVQTLQLAVERCSHLKPAALLAEMANIRQPLKKQPGQPLKEQQDATKQAPQAEVDRNYPPFREQHNATQQALQTEVDGIPQPLAQQQGAVKQADKGAGKAQHAADKAARAADGEFALADCAEEAAAGNCPAAWHDPEALELTRHGTDACRPLFADMHIDGAAGENPPWQN